MPGCGPISKAIFAAKTILLLLGSTHGGNLDERVEFREYVYEGLRNVRWEHSSKLVGAYRARKNGLQNVINTTQAGLGRLV